MDDLAARLENAIEEEKSKRASEREAERQENISLAKEYFLKMFGTEPDSVEAQGLTPPRLNYQGIEFIFEKNKNDPYHKKARPGKLWGIVKCNECGKEGLSYEISDQAIKKREEFISHVLQNLAETQVSLNEEHPRHR
jgi:hypothetical protein